MHEHLSCTLSRLSSSEPIAIVRVSERLRGLHPIHLYWFRTRMTDVPFAASSNASADSTERHRTSELISWPELGELRAPTKALRNSDARPPLMRWTAPHKASRCRRVIVGDESPKRAVHDKNYHHRDRPCKEGVPSPRRRCRGQGRRRSEAQTQAGVGVLRQAGTVSRWHGGLRQCALLGA